MNTSANKIGFKQLRIAIKDLLYGSFIIFVKMIGWNQYIFSINI
jgi:hypothetical protein